MLVEAIKYQLYYRNDIERSECRIIRIRFHPKIYNGKEMIHHR